MTDSGARLSGLGPRRWLVAAFVAVGYFGYGLFPFDFRWPLAPNGAARLPDGTLEFRSPGIALTPDPPPWIATARTSDTLEVLIRVRPYRDDVRGPGRIVTVSRDLAFLNVTLGQEADQLTVTVRTPESFRNGEADYRVPGTFSAGHWREIDVRFEPGRLRVLVDGRLRLDEPLPAQALDRFSDDFWLAAGNEVGGGAPWFGQVSRLDVAVPGARIDYLGSPDLVLPEHIRSMYNRPRLRPFGPTSTWDVLQNVVGFLPLGILVGTWCRLSRPRAALVAGGIGFAVSVTIETAQWFLPDRFPSVDDVWMNTLGAAVGGYIARAALRSRRFSHGQR